MSTDMTVIRQPAGQRVLALREAYLAVCENDTCEAHLLNALERWYGYKLRQREEARGHNKAARSVGEAPDADEALWVRNSAAQWSAELLGQYNEKTIRLKLARLVERGFVSTRHSPKRKWDRTPQWLFQRAAVQAAVDAWEAARPAPALDPGPADEGEAPPHPDAATGSTRTNVRMDADKVPTQVGQSSGSSRTNVCSNNTGVLAQESFPEVLSEEECSNLTSEAPHSSSGNAVPNSEDLPIPQPLVLDPPDGGAANAAREGPLLSLEDLQRMFDDMPEPPTDLEQVPGAAAGERAVGVDDLAPVGQAELAARVPAGEGSETHRALREVAGGALPGLLAETTRTGGLLRGAYWPRLTAEEVREVTAVARAEAQRTSGNMLTLAVRGLDRRIGAVKAPPQTVGGYNGGALAPAKKPAVDTTPEEGQFRAGARWRAKDGGAEATVTAVESAQGRVGVTNHYRLSDGSLRSAFELARHYEFMGPGTAPTAAD